MGQNTVYIGFNNIHGLKASTGGLGTHPPWIRGTTVLSKIPGLKKKKEREYQSIYLVSIADQKTSTLPSLKEDNNATDTYLLLCGHKQHPSFFKLPAVKFPMKNPCLNISSDSHNSFREAHQTVPVIDSCPPYKIHMYPCFDSS